MEEKSKTHKRFASAEQKCRLVHLVEADPQLKSGKFTSTFTKQEAKRRWLNISEQLNSLTGAKKSWEEWRKTWQDRKANAKKKFAYMRRHANLTGGGPPPDPPTEEEIFIINSFDIKSLVGHTDSQESTSSFIDLTYPGSSVTIQTPKPDLPQPDGNENGDESKKDFSQPEMKQVVARDEERNMGDVSEKDLSQPEMDPEVHPGPVVNTGDDRNIGDISKKARLSKSNKPNRRTVAQRRLQDGILAAQCLNKNLEKKMK